MIDESLTVKENKAIVRQIVNEGKRLDDIPRISRALKEFRGLSKSLKLTKLAKFSKIAGPALGVLAALASVQQGVACEGPLAERIEELPTRTRVVLQISYDSVFGDIVENHVLKPAATGWASFWDSVFGLGGMGAKERQLRDAVRRSSERGK